MQACAGMTAYNMTNAACGVALFKTDIACVMNLGGSCFLKTGYNSVIQDADVAYAFFNTFLG
jgi:hypothetical protein